MDFEDGLQLTAKAREKDQEDRAWSIWVALRPNMDEKTFIPFSEFYKAERVPMVPNKTKADILSDVEEIQRLFAAPGR